MPSSFDPQNEPRKVCAAIPVVGETKPRFRESVGAGKAENMRVVK